MAFRAKVTGGPVNDNDGGRAAAKTIDGVAFTGVHDVYEGVQDAKLGFGVPTEAQLAADDLYIETLDGEPWPGSAADRLVSPHLQKRGVIGGRFQMRQLQGSWPTERERVFQRNAAAFFADPVGYAKESLLAYGHKLDGEEASARIRTIETKGVVSGGVVDIASRLKPAAPSGKGAKAAAV